MPSQNGGRSRNSSMLDPNRGVPEASRPLTPRELEVAGWVVAAKRTREIGKILGCSPRTVQKHIQHILEKLDLENRTGICNWWHESGIANGSSDTNRSA